MLSQSLVEHMLDSRSVTTECAKSSPGTTIHQVAESLYPSKHHDAHKDQHLNETVAASETKNDGESKVQKVLKALHIGNHDTQDEVHPDGKEEKWAHQHGKAWEQWENMQQPSAEEFVQIRQCGQWGSALPSDLFLTVSLQLDTSNLE